MSKIPKSKLLMVGGFPENSRYVYGGVVTSCLALADSDIKFLFDLVVLDSTQKSNPPPGLAERSYGSLKRMAKYFVLLRKQKPDFAIFFLSSGLSALEKGAMSTVATWLGVKCILFPRAGKIIDDCQRSLTYSFLIKILFSNSAKVFCQGDEVKRFATECLGKTDHETPVIMNWTATSELIEIGSSRTCVPRTKVRFLFLGWLERQKGVMELLEACVRLKNSGFDFELTLAGGGSFLSEAKNFVVETGLSEFVSFRGWVDRSSVPTLLQENDVFVLPSWHEGLPNAMVESMAAGLAVIVSGVGVIPSLIHDEALVVPPKNVEALYSAMSSLIEDRLEMASLMRKGHKLAVDKFSTNAAVKAINAEILKL